MKHRTKLNANINEAMNNELFLLQFTNRLVILKLENKLSWLNIHLATLSLFG